MASIGSLSAFTGWTGKLHPAVRRMAKLSPRPKVSGEAWVLDDAWTTGIETISTRHAVADQTAADTDIATARDYQDGVTIVAVDPEGRSWNIKVLSVVPDTAEKPGGGVVLSLTWTVQVEAEAP